jgi:hypothetical protein
MSTFDTNPPFVYTLPSIFHALSITTNNQPITAKTICMSVQQSILVEHYVKSQVGYTLRSSHLSAFVVVFSDHSQANWILQE